MVKQGKFVESDSIYLSSTVKVGLLSPYSFSSGYYIKDGGHVRQFSFLYELVCAHLVPHSAASTYWHNSGAGRSCVQVCDEGRV